MNRQDHLNNTQHGFRSGRSCISTLLDVFDDLMHMLSSDTTVDMIYLDFSKAFDKVYHGVLLHKLKDLGITCKLGIWFFQFLTNRTHYVRIPGGISKDSPVLSGVPQGTVLGTLLFLIMISGINKVITSSKLVSFADDTRVYSNIAKADDCNNLQYDLNSIYNRAVHNNMFFNSEKFHYISFSCCCCLPTPITLASGGESDVPACGPPASFSVHLASSAVNSAGSVHKSRGDNVVRMWVQLKR